MIWVSEGLALILSITRRAHARPRARPTQSESMQPPVQHMSVLESLDYINQADDSRLFTPDARTPPQPQAPKWPNGGNSGSFPSGRRALAKGRLSGKWPDGRPIGRGFASAYLQMQYARAMAQRRKTVEGRPGGGWVERNGSLIAPDDYISFKIPAHHGRSLIVRAPP